MNGFRNRSAFDAESQPDRGASRGQILIMFAFFLAAMFGLLGLAIDLGMSFAERRTMQNAADLGAIAGARAIARYTTANPTSALSDVTAIVNGNSMDNAPTVDECNYVDNTGYDVGNCSAPVPVTAVGVELTVSETHPTYFIRVLPGAPANVSTSATAKAEVERLFLAGTDSPFIICGYDTKVSGSSTAVSILSDDDTVNPSAIGVTFVVHNSQIQSCGVNGWKGLAENRPNKANNDGKDLSDTGDYKYWNARTGDQAGPTRVAVAGIDACAVGTDVSTMGSCVMLIPVASDSAHGHAPKCCSQRQLYVVKILAFRVAACGANCHTATLLDDYLSWGQSVANSWTRDTGGVTVVKLRG